MHIIQLLIILKMSKNTICFYNPKTFTLNLVVEFPGGISGFYGKAKKDLPESKSFLQAFNPLYALLLIN